VRQRRLDRLRVHPPHPRLARILIPTKLPPISHWHVPQNMHSFFRTAAKPS
jgi:hypothetical protein